MELHQQLRQLVQQLGDEVLDDADNFRAALDDYLDEGVASRGQIHLLVDTVRLGAYRRMIASLDRGATVDEAVEDAGRWLAYERGTADLGGSRTACEVLAFASGRIDTIGAVGPADPVDAVDAMEAQTLPQPAAGAEPVSVPLSTFFDPTPPHQADAVERTRPTETEPAARHREPVSPGLAPALALLAAACAVSATFLPLLEFTTYTVDGWRVIEGLDDPSKRVRFGVPIVVGAAALSAAAVVVLVRPVGRSSRVALALTGCGMAVIGLLMLTELVHSGRNDTPTSVQWGLWLLWLAGVLSLVSAAITVAHIRATAATRHPPLVLLPRTDIALTLAIVVLALISPWLAWLRTVVNEGTPSSGGCGGRTGDAFHNGWGVISIDDQACSYHSARFGVALVVVAVLVAIALVTLLVRRAPVAGMAGVSAALGATVAIVTAGFFAGSRANQVTDPSLDWSFGVGLWLLLLLGALCLALLISMLRARRQEI